MEVINMLNESLYQWLYNYLYMQVYAYLYLPDVGVVSEFLSILMLIKQKKSNNQ